MIVLLFVGAAVQWFVAGLSTRYLARGNAGGTLVSIVVLQAIWFCNIGPVTESRTWASMAAVDARIRRRRKRGNLRLGILRDGCLALR